MAKTLKQHKEICIIPVRAFHGFLSYLAVLPDRSFAVLLRSAYVIFILEITQRSSVGFVQVA